MKYISASDNEEKTYYKRVYSKIPENEMNFLNINNNKI